MSDFAHRRIDAMKAVIEEIQPIRLKHCRQKSKINDIQNWRFCKYGSIALETAGVEFIDENGGGP
jgi:hypothetical protein